MKIIDEPGGSVVLNNWSSQKDTKRLRAARLVWSKSQTDLIRCYLRSSSDVEHANTVSLEATVKISNFIKRVSRSQDLEEAAWNRFMLLLVVFLCFKTKTKWLLWNWWIFTSYIFTIFRIFVTVEMNNSSVRCAAVCWAPAQWRTKSSALIWMKTRGDERLWSVLLSDRRSIITL